MKHFRKVIKIRAEDSPNVRYALNQIAAGITPDDTIIVPGVLTYSQYRQRRLTWDAVRACIGLDAEFWQGAEFLLFPPEWLNIAARIELWNLCRAHPAEAVGIDPAEGGDKTSMAAVNKYGLKELVSWKTPNTARITGDAIAFMLKHGVVPEKVLFDRGGGGKEHADRLNEQGYKVRSVGFGETPQLEIKRGLHMLESRKDVKEEAYAYVNLRAQMYHDLSMLCDPSINPAGFALPDRLDPYDRLRIQLSVMPKETNEEGRYKLPPKHKRDKNDKRMTLDEMIGHSPDEADAVVLACHAMLHKPVRVKAGAV